MKLLGFIQTSKTFNDFILIQILQTQNEANKMFIELKCIRTKLKPLRIKVY